MACTRMWPYMKYTRSDAIRLPLQCGVLGEHWQVHDCSRLNPYLVRVLAHLSIGGDDVSL